MWSDHVFNDLAAYVEQQLDGTRREQVDRHLAGCSACRQSLDEVRHGIRLASHLRAEAMPADVAARLRSRVIAEATHARMRRAWAQPLAYAAAAAVILVAAAALYWQMNRPWVHWQRATATPTRFELEGRQLHDRLRGGDPPLTFYSRDERALWRWLEDQSAPVTTLFAERTAGERARFAAIGATTATLAGAHTSVLAYRIDGRPVTLALAATHEVAGAPPAGWWSKQVTHRKDQGGANTLTWTVGGGTYVLVSELEGTGEGACVICHTSQRFRERVLSAAPAP